jgi:hypothetical protein
MRMTPKRQNTTTVQSARDYDPESGRWTAKDPKQKGTPHKAKAAKRAEWGKEPADLDADGNPMDVHDGGTHAMPQPQRPQPTDKDRLQKLEAELAEKRRVVEAERAKLAPLEQEAQKLRSAIHREHAEVIADNVDALLAIVPEHQVCIEAADTCSDQNHCNEGQCTRCTLLYIKESRWDATSFNFEVTVTLSDGNEA